MRFALNATFSVIAAFSVLALIAYGVPIRIRLAVFASGQLLVWLTAGLTNLDAYGAGLGTGVGLALAGAHWTKDAIDDRDWRAKTGRPALVTPGSALGVSNPMWTLRYRVLMVRDQDSQERLVTDTVVGAVTALLFRHSKR